MTSENMQSNTTSPKKSISRATRILLVVSLALNLLVGGVIVGAVLSGKAGGPPRFDLNLGPYVRALAPEQRRQIGEALRGRDDLRPLGPRERRINKTAFITALNADPFDATVIEDQLSDQRNRTTRLVDAGQAALVDIIRNMTAEERSAFADRLDRAFRDIQRDNRHHSPADRSDSRSQSGG